VTDVHTDEVGFAVPVHPVVIEVPSVVPVIAIRSPIGTPPVKLRTEVSCGFDIFVHGINQ